MPSARCFRIVFGAIGLMFFCIEWGWSVQVKGAYALPFGTAVLSGWYFSGNAEDGKGYMPNAGYFAGTNHLYDGYTFLTSSPLFV